MIQLLRYQAIIYHRLLVHVLTGTKCATVIQEMPVIVEKVTYFMVRVAKLYVHKTQQINVITLHTLENYL